MRTAIWTFLILALVCTLPACGRQAYEHPLVGVYVLDVDTTLQASAMLRGASRADPENSTAAMLRAQFAPEAYWLELRGDRTFELVAIRDAERFTLGGTWGDVEAGLELRTTAVNGAPPGTEEGLVETVRVQGVETLVLTQAEHTLYLRRREP